MAKLLLAKHNDMVKAIPPDRSDEPLRTSVLPWRSWCYRPISDTHGSKSAENGMAIGAIPIANDISGMPRSVEGQSIPRSDARLHPATEACDGCVAGSGTR